MTLKDKLEDIFSDYKVELIDKKDKLICKYNRKDIMKLIRVITAEKLGVDFKIDNDFITFEKGNIK